MGFQEIAVASTIGIASLSVAVLPLVLVLLLWKRNAGLQRRIEVLEKQLVEGGNPAGGGLSTPQGHEID